jgi:hypothetical protein
MDQIARFRAKPFFMKTKKQLLFNVCFLFLY